MVGDRGCGVFELVPRQNAHHSLIPTDHALRHELFGTGHAGCARRFAAQAASSHLRLGIEDLLLAHFSHHAVAHLKGSKALIEIHRAIDLDGTGDRIGPFVLAVQLVVVVARGREVGAAAFPAQAAIVIQLVERVGTGGVDHSQPRHTIDQAERAQLCEGFSKSARIAKITAGHHDPVGHLPPERFQHPIHDRFLTFQTERVHAVDQIDPQLARHFLHSGHGIVEVAGNLNGERTVVERLREFAVGYFPSTNKDDATHQAGDRTVDGQ